MTSQITSQHQPGVIVQAWIAVLGVVGPVWGGVADCPAIPFVFVCLLVLVLSSGLGPVLGQVRMSLVLHTTQVHSIREGSQKKNGII